MFKPSKAMLCAGSEEGKPLAKSYRGKNSGWLRRIGILQVGIIKKAGVFITK